MEFIYKQVLIKFAFKRFKREIVGRSTQTFMVFPLKSVTIKKIYFQQKLLPETHFPETGFITLSSNVSEYGCVNNRMYRRKYFKALAVTVSLSKIPIGLPVIFTNANQPLYET